MAYIITYLSVVFLVKQNYYFIINANIFRLARFNVVFKCDQYHIMQYIIVYFCFLDYGRVHTGQGNVRWGE